VMALVMAAFGIVYYRFVATRELGESL